ncbi:hypothetical protein [Bifidobacterium indicum]
MDGADDGVVDDIIHKWAGGQAVASVSFSRRLRCESKTFQDAKWQF